MNTAINEADDKSDDIESIEKEIGEICSTSLRSWVNLYRLMNEVEKNGLYKSGYKSFSQWMNHIAKRFGIHVSSLWQQRKAGKVYADYMERAEKRGEKVPDIKNLTTVSPESISLVKSIAGKDTQIADDLISKVVSGDLTREDLRQAAREVHNRREAAGMSKWPANGHEAAKEKADEKVKARINSVISANEIKTILADSGGKGWIDPVYVKYKCNLYHAFSEFDIDPGTSRYVRRIDTMVVETISSSELHSVVLRGIEIKIDVNDLKRDTKMQEYAEYCDYFYICIPSGDPVFLRAVDDYALPEWGILTIDADKSKSLTFERIHVIRQAGKLPGVMRDKSMAEAVIRISRSRK